MKRIINWIKTNKTTTAAVLIAATVFLQEKNIVDTQTSVLITSVLTALGFAVAKDQNDHSTSEDVRKADIEKLMSE